MDSVLRPFLDDFVIVYLGDILIFNKTREDHVLHVNRVLNIILKKEKLFLKMSKCEFRKTFLVYLGHIVGGELRIDPSKVEAIVNWPTPKTVTEVRSFLGVAQYWRKFITKFSSFR